MMPHERLDATRAVLRHLALPLTIAGIALAAILLLRTRETATMSSPTKPEDPGITIPPIDLAAPTDTKTATFAMG